MHDGVPSPDPNGRSPMASPGPPLGPFGPLATKGMGYNYVELNDLKGENAGHNRDPDQDSLPTRPDKSASGSGWWMFEIAACAISTLALGVILATLGLMDGRPLRAWPLAITLNSFIAFMSTIAKAALITPVAEGISQLKWLWFRSKGSLEDIQRFDEASRGSWGSLKLLFHTQQVHWAKLGAFIMIMALCMDPFVQQVVTYPTQMVASADTNATIPISRGYNNYAPGAIMALRSPTLDMKGAINNAIYNTNPKPQHDFGMKPHCATGNCTWTEPYHSLAVCHKCANTTSLITKSNCVNGYCIHSLPNGLSFDAIYRGRLYMNATSDVPTVNFNGTQPTITSVTTMRGLHDASSQYLFGIVANECVLYYCVNEYSAEVRKGVFTETVQRSYTLDSNPRAAENVTIVVPPSGNVTTPTNYTVTNVAADALNYYFSGFWTGNVTGSTGEKRASNDVVRALYDLGDDGTGSGAPKRGGGENDTMAAVAAAMTKVMRSNLHNLYPSGDGDEEKKKAEREKDQVVGVTWVEETYVRVRWPWMVLPVALEALAFCFLLVTIVQCRASGVAIWKSSTLPMLQGKVTDLLPVPRTHFNWNSLRLTN